MTNSLAHLDRRLLMKLGTAGLAALALPGAARAYAATGFTHGVASGEPSATSVLFWTRYAAANDTRLTVEIGDTPDFAPPIAGASVTATGARDHIAKVTVAGLSPDRWYYYRFVAPDGSMSPVGRTRTLPAGPCGRFAMGLVSCANLPFGHFNAYAHAAARRDLDLIVAVGDYLYEYPVGSYPSTRQALTGRLIQPSHEIVALADYRLRYASYRADPDLARLHRHFPMIAQWDDHELANDAWQDGAQNHQADEGDWAVRRAAAEQAWQEWMPVSDDRYRSYEIGDLATIFLPETRITGRDKQFEVDAIIKDAASPAAALSAFRDGAWRDPARQMLGGVQEQWLFAGLAASKRAGKRWQVLAQQLIMGTLNTPPEAANWVGPDAPDFVRERFARGQLAAAAGLPFNLDAWDGYPAARSRILAAAQAVDADLVVLSGDSHNGWAFELAEDGRPAGVEMATNSVTSPGFESATRGVSEAGRSDALRRASPNLFWSNTDRRGYVSVELTPDATTGTWHMLDTIAARSTAMHAAVTHRVLPGRRRYERG